MAVSVKELIAKAKASGARVYSPRLIIPKGEMLTLEQTLTHEDMFGLTTATPVQRAICRAIDGLPLAELWEDAEVRSAFGGCEIGQIAPKIMLILAGIRSGKSQIAAARLVQSSQNVDLRHTSVGDRILSCCLSVDKNLAEAVFNHAIEKILEKPALKQLLIGEPQAESFYLRHPSGRPIQVRVTAVSKHGSTLVGSWLAGLVLDEAPRMASQEEGVRNLEDSIAATRGRILPGASTLLVGSPWQPFGYCYELYTKHLGAPDPRVLVVCAPGPAMNPGYWTPERCEEVKREDPASYEANVLARFTDAESSVFASEVLDRCMRKDTAPLPPDPNHSYVAAMDPATRSNHWTLVVATRGPCWDGKVRDRVVLTKSWKRSAKENLDADQIFREMSQILKPYRVTMVRTDQWASDVLASVARKYDLAIFDETITASKNVEMTERLRIRLADDDVELNGDLKLREELLRVRKHVTRSGYSVSSPILADGSHGDLASALKLCLSQPLREAYIPPPVLTREEFDAQQVALDRKKAIEASKRSQVLDLKRRGLLR
jgi:hypothetical protein